jgi:hypothetical protein
MIEREYEDVAAARAAGAVGEAAWVPNILPDDAWAIHEVHDIDTNDTWGCFKTRDLASVHTALSRLKAAVQAYKEPFAAPALAGFVVRVGIDVTTGTVCFHRSR